MISIREVTQHTIIIKKSEFICTLIPTSDISSVDAYIKQYGKADASHNCYAYIIGNTERASDDGEPSSTAGLPMLNVLKMQGLSNILAIVTRYFGGIKLGTGGLTRAYTSAVADTLKEANIIETELVPLYTIRVDYTYSKKLDYMIKSKDIPLMNQTYDDCVNYECYIKDQSFIDAINDLSNGSAVIKKIKEDYIEKKL